MNSTEYQLATLRARFAARNYNPRNRKRNIMGRRIAYLVGFACILAAITFL